MRSCLFGSCWDFRALFLPIVNLLENCTLGRGWNFPCWLCPEVDFLLICNKRREHYPVQMLSRTPLAGVSKSRCSSAGRAPLSLSLLAAASSHSSVWGFDRFLCDRNLPERMGSCRTLRVCSVIEEFHRLCSPRFPSPAHRGRSRGGLWRGGTLGLPLRAEVCGSECQRSSCPPALAIQKPALKRGGFHSAVCFLENKNSKEGRSV